MTLLNIYSLDDTEDQNVIASLPEGEHLIGRGDLLQVTDKRVSRKHAVIAVSSNQILLKSVHVNPCFLKAVNGKTLSVLSQNQQSELNDGDRFALLPESCWFKVKINQEHTINKPLNGLDNSTAEVNGKRHHDSNLEENNINSEPKRARLSSELHNISTHNEDHSATTSNITLALEHQEDKELDEPPEERNAEETNTSLNVAEPEGIQSEGINMEIKEEPIEGDVSAITSSLLENSFNGEVNTVHNSTTANPEIKEEPIDDSNKEGENDIPMQNNDVSNDQLAEVKTENLDNNENKPMQNNDVSNDQLAEVKTANLDNNENKDGASGSGAGPKKVHRERCWYGAQCFRKNPIHRESFTHPGDEDYEADADDDRPDCPYGTSCYRKNMEHRRDYKHTGKPAQKPSNVNVMLNVNSGCPFCKHCSGRNWGGGDGKPDYESDADDGVARPTSPSSPDSPTARTPSPPNQKKPRRAAAKKPKPQDNIDSSQDDYDLEDPFINDASSDDFQPSDDSGSDTEWEDSQQIDEESQERKRLLKEAKKFTRKGNKK